MAISQYTTILLCALFLLVQYCSACALGHSHAGNKVDYTQAALDNVKAREANRLRARSSSKIAIHNVKVFDGHQLLGPKTVVIDQGIIGSDATGASVIDGQGHVLLPGLIDSHSHPVNTSHLKEFARFGVTSAMVLACPNAEFCQTLLNHPGLTDVRLGSLPAAAVDSLHGKLFNFTANNSIAAPSQAGSWVKQRVSEGADFIKMIAETPGLSQDILTAVTGASHKAKKDVVCHAADYNSVGQALVAGVDQVHHVPLDKPLDFGVVEAYLHQKTISVPTLTMMLATSKAIPRLSFPASNSSVTLLHALGVPILAGTDANSVGTPASVPFGMSLHQELELLVSAGLTPIEALRAATSVPARIWNLHDRGVVKVGMRADLLLIEGDPTKNISATREIRKVWVAGEEFPGI